MSGILGSRKVVLPRGVQIQVQLRDVPSSGLPEKVQILLRLKPAGRGRDLYEAQQFHAESCDECRTCVERCPAGIDVPQRLREVAQMFAE